MFTRQRTLNICLAALSILPIGLVLFVWWSGNQEVTELSQQTDDLTPAITQTTQTPVPKDDSYSLQFHGDTCTVDCSGHEAGYEWAESRGITNPDDCTGNSNSFIEGCQSYAEEHEPAEPSASYEY